MTSPGHKPCHHLQPRLTGDKTVARRLIPPHTVWKPQAAVRGAHGYPGRISLYSRIMNTPLQLQLQQTGDEHACPAG